MRKFALPLLLLFILSMSAAADTILVGAPAPNGTYAFGVGGYQWLAQEFTLTSTVDVSQLTFGSCCAMGTTVDVILTDSLSSGGVVYGTWSFLPGTLPETLPLGATLSAGTYYIIATGVAPCCFDGWRQSTGFLVGAYGTAPHGFYATTTGDLDGPWGFFDVSYGYDTLQFTVEGEPAGTVPEPASLVLLGTGLIAAARRFRNR